jgi:hypothetical protein
MGTAVRASIDLTDAKVDELERGSGDSAGFRGVADRQQAFAGPRYGEGRALHPRLHGSSFVENGFAEPPHQGPAIS